MGSFDAALLLQLVNPVRHGLNHFARSLGRSVALGRRLLLTRSLVFLDYLDSFLF